MQKQRDLHANSSAANTDTLSLLDACYLAARHAEDGIERISAMLPHGFLRAQTERYASLYREFAATASNSLSKYGIKTVSRDEKTLATDWLSAEVKLAFRSSTETLAALLFDKTALTVRSLCHALNRFESADFEVKRLSRRLLGLSEDFCDDLKAYL